MQKTCQSFGGSRRGRRRLLHQHPTKTWGLSTPNQSILRVDVRYGIGEVSQGYTRLCAVHRGVYALRTRATHLLAQEDCTAACGSASLARSLPLSESRPWSRMNA